jgi:hypothetical protein
MSVEGFEKVSLANLANGAALERVDAELERVLDNVADVNTKVKVAREIVLKIKIVPSQDRSIGQVKIQCSSKLAGMEEAEHTIEFGQEGRKQVAYQRKGRQPELPLDNVASIGGEDGKRHA